MANLERWRLGAANKVLVFGMQVYYVGVADGSNQQGSLRAVAMPLGTSRTGSSMGRRPMSQIHANLRVVIAGIVVFVGLGCGDKPPALTSNEEATVTGTVKVRGKSLAGGEVVFDPAIISATRRSRERRLARAALQDHHARWSGTPFVSSCRASRARPLLWERLKTIGKTCAASIEYEDTQFDVQKGENKLDLEFPRPGT